MAAGCYARNQCALLCKLVLYFYIRNYPMLINVKAMGVIVGADGLK
jgi:hypothetical protein